jgi:hypothetical protein
MKLNRLVFAAALFICPAVPAATICTNGFDFGVNTIPEASPESSAVFSCPGFVFAASSTSVAFLEVTGAISDGLILNNSNGVASIDFVSDTEGITLDPPPAPFISVQEPGTYSVIAFTTTVRPSLLLTFASDTNESSNISDTVTIAPATPEPGTGLLFIASLVAFVVCFIARSRSRLCN